jgi:hypothetical protein
MYSYGSVKKMKTFALILSCLLVLNSGNTVLAASTGNNKLVKSTTFNCLTRGSRVNVTIKTNQTYSATSTVQKVEGGNYQTVGLAYRFKTGGLKGQSIVRQKGGIYLVATKSEARAAELATFDAALSCTKK